MTPKTTTLSKKGSTHQDKTIDTHIAYIHSRLKSELKSQIGLACGVIKLKPSQRPSRLKDQLS